MGKYTINWFYVINQVLDGLLWGLGCALGLLLTWLIIKIVTAVV